MAKKENEYKNLANSLRFLKKEYINGVPDEVKESMRSTIEFLDRKMKAIDRATGDNYGNNPYK